MTPGDFLKDELAPGLLWMEQNVGFVPPASREARLLLLAIAGVESNWHNIQQANHGAGIDPWQMQQNTVSEILANPASKDMAAKVCAALSVPLSPRLIWARFISIPNLAVAFARLDLWCDPYPLPVYGDEGHAWHYYLSCWRPGKPSAARWAQVYPLALQADKSATNQGPTP